MAECNIKTCKNIASKDWHGINVCMDHYRHPLGECGDPECHKEATTEWEDMKVCHFHYKQYENNLREARRSLGD